MTFFFPDSVDAVDPGYDFVAEAYSPSKVRQQREVYAHETLHAAPYDGVLVSMAMAGFRTGAAGRAPSRYTQSQRFRLYYSGIRDFLRLDARRRPGKRPLLSMGDAGAYAYAAFDSPPVSAVEVLDFYDAVGFDFGLAPDHIVPGYAPDADPPMAWRRRRDASLALAEDYLRELAARGSAVAPIGVAQGWSPESYADSVRALQAMGYTYVAIGGLAPLGTLSVLACLDAVSRVRRPQTRVHLLGLARPECFDRAEAFGVASFDTTSPLRQAFQDDQHNYHAPDGDHYVAVRVPSWEGNPRLERRVREAGVERAHARALERDALGTVRRYARHEASLAETLSRVHAYEHLFNGKDQTEAYARVLEARPWEACPCSVCRSLGVEVVLYRGAERNRRRGFHNLHVFYDALQRRTAHQ